MHEAVDPAQSRRRDEILAGWTPALRPDLPMMSTRLFIVAWHEILGYPQARAIHAVRPLTVVDRAPARGTCDTTSPRRYSRKSR